MLLPANGEGHLPFPQSEMLSSNSSSIDEVVVVLVKRVNALVSSNDDDFEVVVQLFSAAEHATSSIEDELEESISLFGKGKRPSPFAGRSTEFDTTAGRKNN